MDKVTKERVKTSVTIDPDVWDDTKRLALDLKIEKSEALERALVGWIAKERAIALNDPHARIIASVRKILDDGGMVAEAIRSVVAALTAD